MKTLVADALARRREQLDTGKSGQEDMDNIFRDVRRGLSKASLPVGMQTLQILVASQGTPFSLVFLSELRLFVDQHLSTLPALVATTAR